jgi:hypothetical protein
MIPYQDSFALQRAASQKAPIYDVLLYATNHMNLLDKRLIKDTKHFLRSLWDKECRENEWLPYIRQQNRVLEMALDNILKEKPSEGENTFIS